MSERLTYTAFLRALQQSKLLTQPEVDRIDGVHSGRDVRALAEALVSAGTLTTYQVEAIFEGRGQNLIIGNYEVLDELGAGGMGTVFKARHRRMKRIVALKVLSQQLSSDATFVQRFQREVETIARLSHPNIVMAYDAAEDAVGHFLVMEFVDGCDLATMVQKQGTFDIRAAVDCLLQAARGLDCAHRQGIIHRDIKPANLLRDRGGIVKVTDLGLARISADTNATSAQTADCSLTKVGGMMGTADYMPPEQAIDAASADHRADIYSLGGTLYFLLHGKGPYASGTFMATLVKHREAPIPVLGHGRVAAPAALEALFQRLLAKQPHQRPQTMAEVVSALEAILGAITAPNDNVQRTPVTPAPEQPPLPPSHGDTVNAQRADSDSVRTLNVLIVEPSRTQAGIIRRYLQAIAVTSSTVVATGKESLRQVQASKPDVVVSAMTLDDMNGADLARQVRTATPTAAPGFVLVSSSQAEVGATLSETGLGVTLRKPFTAAELAYAIKMSTPALSWVPIPSDNAATAVRPANTTLAYPSAPGGAGVRGQRLKSRVLIVDDSAAARLHERDVLRKLGFAEFVEVADGAQAVAAVCKDKFDLIVTDYHMPLMDGSAFVSFLRQQPGTSSVPIIMVTTETDAAKLESIRKLGVLAICSKTFPAETVRSIIDQVF